MNEDNSKNNNKDQDKNNEGYPLYPPSEDIYSQADELSEIDPNDITKKKSKNVDADAPSEKSFYDDVSGGDLDIPGSELDDAQEEIGSEDEENNGYSMAQD